MNKENDEPWRDWEIEDWEHDIWKTRQIIKIDCCYKNKEERAKEAYFQEIKEEEEKGIYRQTVAELIEERSAARKLMKEMEKEEDKEDANSDKTVKCEEEAEVSTEREDKGASLDPPLQPLDSPTSRQPNHPTDIDASIQKTPLLWSRCS